MSDGGRRFPAAILDLLRVLPEIEIETRLPPAPAHRTIIWVVVDDDGRALIRTYRGPSSRWYREALAGPETFIWLDPSAPLAVRVEHATDPARVAAASEGYVAKYPDDPATGAMLRDLVLPTTLELLPR